MHKEDLADLPKRSAAWKACEEIRDGMRVGLGTGRTASHAIRRIGELVVKGLKIEGVPTSRSTEKLAREVGIPLVPLEETEEVDLAIDGADEVDGSLNLIKGGGGALFREKIVASLSRRVVIVVEDSKLVPVLGSHAPLPLEVAPFARAAVLRHVRSLGLEATLRTQGSAPFFTENGNLVVDVRRAGGWSNPQEWEDRLQSIPGVVETGLFVGMAHGVYSSDPSGKVRLLLPGQRI